MLTDMPEFSATVRTVPTPLRLLRLTEGFTQEALAAKACVAPDTVSDAERGLRTPLRATAAAIADALGYPPEAVFPDLFPADD